MKLPARLRVLLAMAEYWKAVTTVFPKLLRYSLEY
jgi:hypothetical protein